MRVPEQFTRRGPIRRGFQPVGGPILTPVQQALAMERHRYRAVVKTTITDGGSVLVECPYCIVYFRQRTMVDVTKFVDGDGKREVTTYCLRGHVLRFKSTDEWRAARAARGVVPNA